MLTEIRVYYELCGFFVRLYRHSQIMSQRGSNPAVVIEDELLNRYEERAYITWWSEADAGLDFQQRARDWYIEQGDELERLTSEMLWANGVRDSWTERCFWFIPLRWVWRLVSQG